MLAHKFITLFLLSKELLSKQMHYDWGLRAMSGVLEVAGSFLRAEKKALTEQGLSKEIVEQGLLMRALRDFNVPKIAGDDGIVFMGLIRDLFEEVRGAAWRGAARGVTRLGL